MNVSQTLQTYWDILKMCMRVFDGLELILRELRPFKLSYFSIFFALRVKSTTHCFWRILFMLCKHVGNIRKICMWLLNIDKNNFDNYSHLNF